LSIARTAAPIPTSQGPAALVSRRGLDLSLLDPDVGVLSPADEGPEARATLRAWLQLQATLGLRPQEAIEALRRNPSPHRALAISKVAPRLRPRQLDSAIRVLQRTGARAVPILAAEYPARLRVLSDAAPLLLAAGAALAHPDLFERPCVAIVGARAATAYGLHVAHELARDLAGEGVVVVSGLARGVDAAAHSGALEAQGITLAVQACGPDRVYPPEHRALWRRIQERGLVLTEMPPGTPPRGPYFPLRNRIIAAIASIVVVVEARQRSGSLTTARHALDQGSEVMAVPGPIRAPTSAGPNALIYDGATPVLSVTDVLDELGVRAGARTAASSPGSGTGSVDTPLEPGAQSVVDALRKGPVNRDEFMRSAHWSPDQLALHLIDLELAGRVVLDRDGRYWLADGERV